MAYWILGIPYSPEVILSAEPEVLSIAGKLFLDGPNFKEGFAGDLQTSGCPGLLQLIQTEMDENTGDRSPGQGSLRFRQKSPMELRGPMGHGSSRTLLPTDLNSLPEDDQKGLGRSLETLTAAEANTLERNARTESAKSTPLHKLRDVIMESPLEITEL